MGLPMMHSVGWKSLWYLFLLLLYRIDQTRASSTPQISLVLIAFSLFLCPLSWYSLPSLDHRVASRIFYLVVAHCVHLPHCFSSGLSEPYSAKRTFIHWQWPFWDAPSSSRGNPISLGWPRRPFVIRAHLTHRLYSEAFPTSSCIQLWKFLELLQIHHFSWLFKEDLNSPLISRICSRQVFLPTLCSCPYSPSSTIYHIVRGDLGSIISPRAHLLS